MFIPSNQDDEIRRAIDWSFGHVDAMFFSEDFL